MEEKEFSHVRIHEDLWPSRRGEKRRLLSSHDEEKGSFGAFTMYTYTDACIEINANHVDHCENFPIL